MRTYKQVRAFRAPVAPPEFSKMIPKNIDQAKPQRKQELPAKNKPGEIIENKWSAEEISTGKPKQPKKAGRVRVTRPTRNEKLHCN